MFKIGIKYLGDIVLTWDREVTRRLKAIIRFGIVHTIRNTPKEISLGH
jgi:hypothetical protein